MEGKYNVNFKEIIVHIPEVQKQLNNNDCGVYVLHFLHDFLLFTQVKINWAKMKVLSKAKLKIYILVRCFWFNFTHNENEECSLVWGGQVYPATDCF